MNAEAALSDEVLELPEPPDRPGLLKISTDGSAISPTKHTPAAGYGVFFGPGDPRNEGGPVGPGKQTNQRAELKAVLIALQKASNKVDVLVRTDSQYAAQAVTEWYYDWRIQNWKKPEGKHRQNEHLIEQIVTLMKRRARLMVTTEFTWVKGHSGDPGNEAADALASAGSRTAHFQLYGRWPHDDVPPAKFRPGAPDFVKGFEIVKRPDGTGEERVPLSAADLEVQRSVMTYGMGQKKRAKIMQNKNKNAVNKVVKRTKQ